MGQEIVYCFKCATRLTGADFEKGRAVRAGNKAACKGCAAELLAALPPEPPRQATPPKTARVSSSTRIKAASTTRLQAPPPPPSRGKAGLYAMLGAVALTVAGLLAFAFSGRTPRPPEPPPGPPVADPKPLKPPPEDPRLREAREAIEKAARFARDHPADLDGQVNAYAAALKAADRTPLAREAAEMHDAVVLKRKNESEREALKVADRAQAAVAREDFKGAIEIFQAAGMEDRARGVRKEADARLAALCDEARRGPKTGHAKLRERVAGWGLPELAAALDREIGAPPVPLTEEMKTYRAAWRAAVARAAAREFDEAAADLSRAAREAKEEAVRAEAAGDADDLRRLGDLCGQAVRRLAATPRGQALDLEVRDEAGAKRRAKGKVVRAGPARVELAGADGKPHFVDWSDVTAAWLVAAFPGVDRRLAAIAVLIEGDAAGAEAPEKYRELAGTAKVPRPPARELEARALFAQAEAEFARMESLAAAVAKAKTLLADFGDTRLVKGEFPHLERRAGSGREYFLCGAALRGEGTFRAASPPRVGSAWVSAEDSDEKAAIANFVEAEFCALPEAAYRCWILAGGCCADSFTFLYQATEGTDVHPRTRQKVSIDPGGSYASPGKHSIAGLRKMHAFHAKNKEPKAPERWEWIAIPLPKYSAAGLKKVRLLTDQQGFAVAAVFVSSARSAPPSEVELKEEMSKARPAGPEAAAPPPAGKPWRALFDGKSLDCLRAGGDGWRIENGAIANVPGPGNAAQTREEFEDGEVRIRFEMKDLDAAYFKLKQGGPGGYAVRFEGQAVKGLEGKVHELIFVAKGDQVTATLDGAPVGVQVEAPARRGCLQFNANGKSLILLSLDTR